MPAQWTGDIVRKMHIKQITNAALAKKLKVTDSWVSMVLNGKRDPKGAEIRFNAAVDEIITEKEGS